MKENLLKFIALAAVLFLTATFGAQITVLAGANDTSQAASTTKTTTFLVGGTESTTTDSTLTTITFPELAPAATSSVPWNNLDTVHDPQVLSATESEPVSTISNTHGSAAYDVVLEITTWTNSLVDMEYYNLVADGCTTTDTVTSELSNAAGAARTVSTGVSIPASEHRDLYLKLVMGSISGKSSTSTLTILGETP